MLDSCSLIEFETLNREPSSLNHHPLKCLAPFTLHLSQKPFPNPLTPPTPVPKTHPKTLP